MTVTDYGRPSAFRIGRVFGDSFAVFGRNIVLCLGLAIIFSGIPSVLYQWWTLSAVGSTDPAEFGQFDSSQVIIAIVAGIASFVLSSVLQAALTRASIEDLNGERPTFGDCLSTAFSVLLPIIGIAILVGIGTVLGFMLLIVPGVILWLRWSVSIPVQVNEKLGVMGSMSRSAELTTGSRWALFGLYIILIIIVIAIQFLLGLSVTLLTSLFGAYGALALLGLVSTIATIALSIVAAVAYVELRLVKEGTDVKDLAEIFA